MRIVDLTHPVAQGMPVYPGDPPVEIGRLTHVEDSGYNVSELHIGAHTGTHIDAPFHSLADGAGVDRLDLETLIGWAEVLDFSDKGPGSQISTSDLKQYDNRITKGSRLLIRTGWSRRFYSPEFFSDHPVVTEDAANWLVERHISLLGIEQPSVHIDRALEVHSILLKGGVVLIETLANLDQLTQNRVWLIALPLRLVGLDGSPARVVAIEDASPFDKLRMLSMQET